MAIDIQRDRRIGMTCDSADSQHISARSYCLADSLFGTALEVSKYVLLFFIIGTILVYTPWQTGKSQVAEGKVYQQIKKPGPGVIAFIQREVEKVLFNPRI